MFFEVTATVCAGMFAGAALYITLVEHPVALDEGVEAAAAAFPGRYHRGAAMQAPLALAGSASGMVAWATGSGPGWLASALALGAVVPFTLGVIAPAANRALLDPALDRSSPGTRALLVRWGRLHAVRTVLGVGAFAAFSALLAAD